MIDGAADRNEHGDADFAGVCSGDAGIFLCLDGQGARGAPPAADAASDAPPSDDRAGGMWMSWWFETPADVDAAYERALEQGVTVTMPPRDEPWGARECRIMHPDGHVFRLACGLTGGDIQNLTNLLARYCQKLWIGMIKRRPSPPDVTHPHL
jgi:catechol 2,3-dioxygenase-like lactoylglutathione lyase family enzyme